MAISPCLPASTHRHVGSQVILVVLVSYRTKHPHRELSTLVRKIFKRLIFKYEIKEAGWRVQVILVVLVSYRTKHPRRELSTLVRKIFKRLIFKYEIKERQSLRCGMRPHVPQPDSPTASEVAPLPTEHV